MTKRKILLLAMSLCMVAILAVGGTLAYFTDTESVNNVFTYGNVDIRLDENFPEQELMPGEQNALDKVVTVANIGKSDAYMWIEILIPTILDAGADNAKDNDLHWNPFNTYKDSEGNIILCRVAEAAREDYTLVAETVSEFLGTELVDYEDGEVEYYRYRIYIKDDEPKAQGESTEALLARVFMDKRVDTCKDPMCLNGEECLVLIDGTHYAGTWEIIVYAYGIQAQGINSITEAIAAYGAQFATAE